LERAHGLTPFAFFAHILHAQQGRQKMLEKLGLDAADALDEFLSLSLSYEKNHVPTLQGFVAWMADNQQDIKRPVESAGKDEVRILTVHGSKGLEAPVVLLPDTVSPPSDLPALLWVPLGDSLVPCMTPSEADAPLCLQVFKAIEARKQQEEYHRLLYVALTRAKEHLYVCGWKGSRRVSPHSWYTAIHHAISSHEAASVFPFCAGIEDWQGEGVRLSFGAFEKSAGEKAGDTLLKRGVEGEEFSPPAEEVSPLAEEVSPPAEEFSPLAEEEGALAPEDGPLLPAWALSPVPLEVTPQAVAVTQAESPLSQGTASLKARERGVAIHRLLETLLPVLQAGRFLKDTDLVDLLQQHTTALVREGFCGAREAEAYGAQVFALLKNEELQWIWSPQGLSEVPVWGMVDGQLISGRIDRLVVREADVVLIDFKTDARPTLPLPEAYQRQLLLYRQLVAPLYSQPVRCALLWTQTSALTWLT
jgi:ATP-dependent helicase/nuclease subunit A